MKTFFRNMFPGLWLIAAIPMALLIFEPFKQSNSLNDSIRGVAMVLTHLLTGYLWGHALTRRARLQASKLANLAAGIGFAFSVVGGLIFFEDIFNNLIDLLGARDTTHLEFGTIFITWTGFVTGITGLALGIGLKHWRLALKMLVVGFITGAGVFFTVTFLMDWLGFRVGVPRADGIPSMPVVTPLGVWLAALVGSGVFGRVLAEHHSDAKTNQRAIAEDLKTPIYFSEQSTLPTPDH